MLAIKQTKHGTQTQRRLHKGCGAHRADCTIVRQSTRSIDERGCRQVSADLGVGLSTLNKWVNAFSKKVMPAGPSHNLVRDNDRQRHENRILKEEREVLK
jgi:transposase-like protein